MRVFVLLLLSYSALAQTVTNDSPRVFESWDSPIAFDSEAGLHRWATSTFGGASMTELTYQKYKLVVYIRSYTSGVSTSEPFVFMEKNGKWYRILTSMTCPCEMKVAIEGDTLFFWRWEWPLPHGKGEKVEYMRFNLKNLPLLQSR